VFAEADNVIAKPRFADRDAGDFHLEAGDPCLAKYTGTMSLSGGAPAPPPPPPPPPPPASGSPTVTLRASTPAVRPGRVLKLRGNALGAQSAGRAVIHKRQRHHWERVKAPRIRDGRFSLRLRPRTRQRALRFRATVGRLGHSRTVLVRVVR
jgi:hypothetical protein